MNPNQPKDFLLEIGTEELPPKQIGELVTALVINLEQNLQELALPYTAIKTYSSPRRLAVLISDLASKQLDQPSELRGPPLAIAFDKSGQPTAAAIKFAKLCGVEVAELKQVEDKKGVLLFHKTIKTGKETIKLLPEVIIQSIKKLPIKRPMFWGKRQGPFVRPIHWILALFGHEIIPVEIFGIKASNQTFGHRFHNPEPMAIAVAKQYESILAEKGFVIADHNKRRQKIQEQITPITKNGTAIISENLLTEVTNLVEWPVALIGTFNPKFLEVPQEVLITTLQTHQRYFPIIASSGKLLPQFIIICNIESKHPEQVVAGNERVINARLTDAEYFYNNDLKLTFASYLDKLKAVTFQEGLGTLFDKTMRLKALAPFVALKISSDVAHAKQAAHLSKCDLVTSMVREFPELQGTMGYYYASINENQEVASALKEQYLPRFSKDDVPSTKTGCVLGLADRIDTLVGFFGIHKTPTGDKDPFGLRRAATGVLRIILEKNIPLDLKEFLNKACLVYKDTIKIEDEITTQVLAFIYERLHHLYLEQGRNTTIFRAVSAIMPTVIQDFVLRFEAVDKFIQLPEAADLIEIYKRIRNILDKAKFPDNIKFNLKLATEPAEHNLATMVTQEVKNISDLYQKQKYFDILATLVNLKQPLHEFFEKVMVMTDDKKLRDNRLALLTKIQKLFMLVADLAYIVSGNKSTF